MRKAAGEPPLSLRYFERRRDSLLEAEQAHDQERVAGAGADEAARALRQAERRVSKLSVEVQRAGAAAAGPAGAALAAQLSEKKAAAERAAREAAARLGLPQHGAPGVQERRRRSEAAAPPPSPRTKWTRRVPHPVLIGHAASPTHPGGRTARCAQGG